MCILQEITGDECKQNRRGTKSLAACKVKSRETFQILFSILSLSPLQLEPQPFAYGAEGTAKYQLGALAALSHVATQSIALSCTQSSQPIRMLGHNGQEISVRDYSWNFNYELAADQRCQVR